MNFSDRWIETVVAELAGWPIDIVDDKPRQIFLDEAGEIFALVSAADYDWAVQWRWKWNWDRTKSKRYAIRTPRRAHPAGGYPSVTVYLHKEILARHKKPPSELHFIGDHQNGESLDCRIENLEWATRSQNRRNRRR